jgi:hypothetical protein
MSRNDISVTDIATAFVDLNARNVTAVPRVFADRAIRDGVWPQRAPVRGTSPL